MIESMSAREKSQNVCTLTSSRDEFRIGGQMPNIQFWTGSKEHQRSAENLNESQ